MILIPNTYVRGATAPQISVARGAHCCSRTPQDVGDQPCFWFFYEPSLESCIHQPLSSHCGMQKRSQITLESDFLWCINMCRVRRFFSQCVAHRQCLNILAPSFGHPIRSLTVSPCTSDRICTQTCPEGGLQTAGLEGHVMVTFPMTLCA